MTESNATRVLTLAIPGLFGLGAVSALVGGFPWLSVATVLVALGLVVGHRSAGALDPHPVALGAKPRRVNDARKVRGVVAP